MYLDIATRSTAAGTVAARSNKPEVRNPLLALPSGARAADMPPAAREWLVSFLQDLRRDAQQRAAKAWKTHKAPIALYFKIIQVYSGHRSGRCDTPLRRRERGLRNAEPHHRNGDRRNECRP